MYKDGWWLAMKTERIPWLLTPGALALYAPGVWDPDAGPVELYHLPDDFTQARDLAADHPAKVQELKDLFWQEAERYKVLPLLSALSTFFGMLPPLPEETTFEFRGDVENVMPGMIPRIYNRSYAITADLVVPDGGAEGVIVAEADHLGGFTLYVKDGKLTHTYSMMGVFVFKQVAEEGLPTGDVTVRMEFEADGATPATGGDVTLLIDDRPVGKGRMDHTVSVRFSGYSGMYIGRDNGGVVDRSYEYEKPFAFTGTVKKVVFDITPHLLAQDELELHTAEQRREQGPRRQPLGGAHRPHGRRGCCRARLRRLRRRPLRAAAPRGDRRRRGTRCRGRQGAPQAHGQQARGDSRQDDPPRRRRRNRRLQARRCRDGRAGRCPGRPKGRR
jgi:hypothetical protein